MAVFEEFDEQFKGKIDVYKCEIDTETGKLKKYFQMTALPAMVMMKNNKPYANSAGPVSAASYQNLIRSGIVKIMEEQKQQKSGYSTISAL
jgi:thioredoxin-like negative regulator of GroEL